MNLNEYLDSNSTVIGVRLASFFFPFYEKKREEFKRSEFLIKVLLRLIEIDQENGMSHRMSMQLPNALYFLDKIQYEYGECLVNMFPVDLNLIFYPIDL
jgi:hypothetical protein